MGAEHAYRKGFLPYALAAFLIGLVGGFSTVLGPAFVQDIGLAYNNTTWTALAQAASTAACAPILGKLGDILGRRITLLVGIAVFTLGNIGSALAKTLGVMLAARFVVGLGTAAMTPVIIAYIVTQFPKSHMAKGFALYMLISSASVIFGPTLGGWLIEAYSWRVMLWVCVAVCLAVFAACLGTAEQAPPPRQALQGFDGAGAGLVLLFFGLLLCLPAFGQNFGWYSGAFCCVLLAALVALAALLAVERRALHPILPGDLIKRRAFVLSVFALFLTQGLMQANMTNTIVFVRYTQPENTLISGYAISVMYLGMSLGAALLGPLADRFEPKKILLGSFFLTGIGCAMQSLFSAQTGTLLLAAALGLLGFGLGGNGTIFMKVVLSGLPAQEAGTGTGIYGLFRDLAAPFGVAVFVPLFTNQITRLLEQGAPVHSAAPQAMKTLAGAELICIAAGAVAVLLLPKLYRKGEAYEIKE